MKIKLSHYDSHGRARMVDVSEKSATKRTAVATAVVKMSSKVLAALPENPKGDPFEVARVAGIMAAKRTSELVPMCHPDSSLARCCAIWSCARMACACAPRPAPPRLPGVEMEAMMAASVAALTVYDMCKALDKGIEIREVVLESKSGGKSGSYRRPRKAH